MKLENKVKNKLAAGSAVYGTFMMSNDPAVGEILGYSGLDFILVDTEHSPTAIQHAEHIFRAIDNTEATPFMRVIANQQERILQAIDCGAKGVVVPQVNSAAEARSAVKAARYYPLGERGVCGLVRAARYGSIPFTDYAVQSNETVMLLTQVEHVDAVTNLDEILAVDGIDGIFIGPADLSQSMGISGQFDNPDFIATVSSIVKRAQEAGKIVGMFCFDAVNAKHWNAQGVNFLVVSADSVLLSGAARTLANELRG